jgi:hypothetical protein
MEEDSIHGKLQSLVESEVPPKKKKDALLESEAATKPPVRRVVVMHLAYGVIWQRNFSLDIQSLYHEVCKLFVRKCGFMTTEKILFSARNFSLKILSDLKDLLVFDYWHHLLSKIQQERVPSTHFKDN